MKSSIRPLSRRRRPVLLLEVLIALGIVALALIPLIQPHFAVLRAERAFVKEIDRERLLDQLIAERIVELYNNLYSWADITAEASFDVSDPRLEELGYIGQLSFRPYRKKGDLGDEEGDRHYLFQMTLRLFDQKNINEERYAASQLVYIEKQ